MTAALIIIGTFAGIALVATAAARVMEWKIRKGGES